MKRRRVIHKDDSFRIIGVGFMGDRMVGVGE